jgi:hypothetical protein
LVFGVSIGSAASVVETAGLSISIISGKQRGYDLDAQFGVVSGVFSW